VSPSLSPLLAYSQISIALKLRHCAPSLARTPPSPIVPSSLADDFTVAIARHLAVDRPSRAPSDQINPSTIIPYPYSCLTTIPSTQNQTTGKEPPQNFTGDRFSPPRTALPPRHFLFSISFSYVHVSMHILLFYAPKIVQINYRAQNNNI
jgi:hypothetical protein